jgi:hypothetical protein
MIVAYLPAYRIMVEADIFNPPLQENAPAPEVVNPFHTNFVDNLERLGLNVNLILPIHGRKTSRAELYKMAGRN